MDLLTVVRSSQERKTATKKHSAYKEENNSEFHAGISESIPLTLSVCQYACKCA